MLNIYTVNDFAKYYQAKYPNNTMLISIPYALTYFDDAEESEEPISLKGQTWDGVKSKIQFAVRKFFES